MKTIALIIVWLLISSVIWIFATALKVDDGKFKHYEFKIRSVFYWVAILISFFIGYII